MKNKLFLWIQDNCNVGVANGKIRDLPRRRDPSEKSEPETLWWKVSRLQKSKNTVTSLSIAMWNSLWQHAPYCPASSEQSIFLTKSTPIRNVKVNFLPPQSYAAPTRYAPVLAHHTVHTVVPSIVTWTDKNLHTYWKPWNKHHQLNGLLRFKKPTMSRKLYSFRAGFYQVLWRYASLHTFETVLLPALNMVWCWQKKDVCI